MGLLWLPVVVLTLEWRCKVDKGRDGGLISEETVELVKRRWDFGC